MSTRPSIWGSAVACSGAMYAGVPNATPAEVSRGPLDASVTALATPKSMTIACRPDSITFSGLMSRWTTPARWAVASASAISPSSRTASGTGSSPPRVSRSRSVSPSTYGIT